jgi:hypothetical protein
LVSASIGASKETFFWNVYLVVIAAHQLPGLFLPILLMSSVDTLEFGTKILIYLLNSLYSCHGTYKYDTKWKSQKLLSILLEATN